MSGKDEEQPDDPLFRPHFRARIAILSKDEGGPWRGYLDFGPDGMTSLVCEFPGHEGRQAIILRHRPDARIADGESFEADCLDTGSGLLTDALLPGLRFEVWSGRVLAHGEITAVFPDNWILPPEGGAYHFCPQCKGRWRHPRSLTPEILRQAGEEARRRSSPITALVVLKNHGASIAEGKAISHHLARDGSFCHRCAAELPEGENVLCPACKALNYRW